MNIQFSHSHSLLWVVLWQARCSATHSFSPPQEPLAQILTKVFPVSSVLVIHSYDNSFCMGFHIRLSFSAECLIPCIYFNLKHLEDPKMLLNNPPPWGEVPGPWFHISAGPLRTLGPLFSFPAAWVSHSFASSLDTFYNAHIQEATSSLSDIKESLHHFKPHIPNRPQITQVQVDYAIFWKHWIVWSEGVLTHFDRQQSEACRYFSSAPACSLWLANEE